MDNRSLLWPIKAHFFFFMAALGPILPQLPVYGKELGISPVIMGTVSGILPLIFLLAKPTFGIIVDVFRSYRKTIFMMLIFFMCLSFASLYFLPNKYMTYNSLSNHLSCKHFTSNCNNKTDQLKTEFIKNISCSIYCDNYNKQENISFQALAEINELGIIEICEETNFNLKCDCGCKLSCSISPDQDQTLFNSFTFWGFIILMSVGNICFNVTNSISDAICFDVIGEKYDYGKQRVWGAVGFGVTALVGGYLVNGWSSEHIRTYTPAFIVMIVFTFIDLLVCLKLKLPVIPPPENVFKLLFRLVNEVEILIFFIFAILAGIVDSVIIYFLFWFLEDLAIETDTGNIKLLEGLIVAAETLGGEILFFIISGKIISKLGYEKCFGLCFINYGIRLLLISLAPSPWWILPIEFVMQGPTYALMYTTIVAYANAIAPPGMSATMQGISAGLDDGFGYAIGCFTVGILYEIVGGKTTLQIFSALAFTCGIILFCLIKFYGKKKQLNTASVKYDAPDKAINTGINDL